MFPICPAPTPCQPHLHTDSLSTQRSRLRTDKRPVARSDLQRPCWERAGAGQRAAKGLSDQGGGQPDVCVCAVGAQHLRGHQLLTPGHRSAVPASPGHSNGAPTARRPRGECRSAGLCSLCTAVVWVRASAPEDTGHAGDAQSQPAGRPRPARPQRLHLEREPEVSGVGDTLPVTEDGDKNKLTPRW